uniref:Uncharacterized protein n=1 Tax=Heterorhabditis bacteriophora TaxID=37862 RepID=A0A1I7XBL8_HETBA
MKIFSSVKKAIFLMDLLSSRKIFFLTIFRMNRDILLSLSCK